MPTAAAGAAIAHSVSSGESGGQRQHAIAHELRKRAVAEWAVVEVGSQRDDDPQARAWIGRSTLDQRQELPPTLFVVDEREQLLELVDHENELGGVVGKNALRGAAEPTFVGLQLLDQACGRIDGNPEQGGLELLEGPVARCHLDDPPCLGAWQRTLPESGQEPRKNERRFAAAARADNGDEPLSADPLEELAAHRLSPEEVARVGLPEGPQALVRVPDRGRRLVTRDVGEPERRVLTKQHARELAKRRRSLDAELVVEDLAHLVVDLERVRLAPGAVQREHEVCAQLLAQRVLTHELLEFGDELSVHAALQVGFDAALEHSHTKLLESRDRRLRERLVEEVRQRRPAPERECMPEQGGRRIRVPPVQRAGGFLCHVLDAKGVELLRTDAKEIAGRVGLEHRLAAVRVRLLPEQFA